MVAKVEMSLGEWVARMTCKLLAFGAAILGLWGFVIFGLNEVIPAVVAAKYDVAVCVAIACVAVLFGVTPMAIGVDRALLRAFRLMPLPSDSKR